MADLIIHAYSNKPCTIDQMPVLRPLPDSEDWANVYEWWFHSKTGYICKVPAGFICDLDSVPRVPVIYALFKNRSVAGVLGHDWEFTLAGLLPQKDADKLMMEIALWEGTERKHIRPMYRAVRTFGHRYYRKRQPRYL